MTNSYRNRSPVDVRTPSRAFFSGALTNHSMRVFGIGISPSGPDPLWAHNTPDMHASFKGLPRCNEPSERIRQRGVLGFCKLVMCSCRGELGGDRGL